MFLDLKSKGLTVYITVEGWKSNPKTPFLYMFLVGFLQTYCTYENDCNMRLPMKM